ncbi:protein translocase subunit secF [Antricoccus suffuscus]|uniref:Protein-export membrane protein SecF n=1 Tax=Antricoccus suffuscus TaxID=1629062 RepID=A0A2T0ZW73_9ACTN|nr:protein translocase subunit SecF [Antricoccus suffuscus]PRZ40611.1 protein translocase subunit secF [Antricoccus suffuscus]
MADETAPDETVPEEVDFPDNAKPEETTPEEPESEQTVAAAAVASQKQAKKRNGFGHRLYTGEAGFHFVENRKRFYYVSIALVLASLALFVFKGLNFGIDFAGGNTFQVPGKASEVSAAKSVVQKGLDAATKQAKADAKDPGSVAPAELATAQVVGTGNNTSILIKTTSVSPPAATAISNSLAAAFESDIKARLAAAGTPVTTQSIQAQVSNNAIDATWGSDVSRKAVIALLVFLVAVSIFLRIRYRMGLVVGALVALLHDLVVTAGIYALVGFEVTPATVIGLLTILGFSLYDTVVVFDKVDENTRGLSGGSRMTFSEGTNLAINQTLMRSINTTVISLLPVAALLFVGAGLLGAGTLKDLALVLLIGMAAGAYSSIFLAAPIACDITERRPEYRELAKRVKNRENKDAKKAEKVASSGDSVNDAEVMRVRQVVTAGVGAKPKPGAKPLVGKPSARPVAAAKAATPAKAASPAKKAAAPAKKAAAPAKKAATPAKAASPAKKSAAPAKSDEAPAPAAGEPTRAARTPRRTSVISQRKPARESDPSDSSATTSGNDSGTEPAPGDKPQRKSGRK